MPLPRSLALALMMAVLAALAVAQPTGHSSQAVEAEHPAEDYRRATEAWRAGRREEATFLFYRGQYRFRVHLKARPGLPPDGDPALFASFSESLGRPINEWAFGDLPAWSAMIDRVLAETGARDDRFTPKAQFASTHAEIRRGLQSLQRQVMSDQESVRRQRAANGLENRR